MTVDYQLPEAADRAQRVSRLVGQAHALVHDTIEQRVFGSNDRWGRRLQLAAICLLYSGGNDSTVLAHLMRGVATHAIHANTGIGIEATHVFVRDNCRDWGLPLLEDTRRSPTNNSSCSTGSPALPTTPRCTNDSRSAASPRRSDGS